MIRDTLLTDLYQLTMCQAYFDEGMNDVAVFELFIRKLPNARNFFLAAGLEQVIQYVTQLHFNKEDLEFLAQQKLFSESFLQSLGQVKFTGDIYAMPEGTPFFPYEPCLQIIAPITQAQFIESRIINLLHMQTLIASKAARCVLTAPNKNLIDFGMRRAHGFEASLAAARASYIAGFQGTATVLAGQQYGIPIFGTMAHSYIQAHGCEEEAFLAYAHAQPNNLVFLIDTYDTEKGAQTVVKIMPQLKAQGLTVKAVRLDSGDLGQHAVKVRKILDDAGFTQINIFCSGDLDEYKLLALEQNHYPINSYGIGTRLDTSQDAPSLDCVYKLQEYKGRPKRKLSEGKATWPGRKQVYRYYDSGGQFDYDVITRYDDVLTDGQPLLQPVVVNGQLVRELPSLTNIRSYTKQQLERLPTRIRSLEEAVDPYKVEIAKPLHDLADQLAEEIKATK